MNLEDDFEEADWRRRGFHNIQLHDDEVDSVDDPVIVSLKDDELETSFNQTVLIAGAKSKRQVLRAERSSTSLRIPSSMWETTEDEVMPLFAENKSQDVANVADSPSPHQIVELSNDEDDSAWQSVVSSRINRFAGHEIFDETLEPPSFKPVAPIAPLKKAKEAFMQRVKAKRDLLEQKDRERVNADLERGRLMGELQTLNKAIIDAQKVVSSLEMNI